MKTKMKSLILSMLCLNILLQFAYSQPDGFRKLFNGKTLEGWWGLGTENPEIWMKLPEN